MCTAEADSDGPRYTGLVDEDGFCKDLLAVQAMSGAMVARQASVAERTLLKCFLGPMIPADACGARRVSVASFA